jgi:hypothetical protein
MTTRLANVVVAPVLLPALAGGADRRDELKRTTANRMSDGNLTELTVCAVDGRILFSDDPSRPIPLRSSPPRRRPRSVRVPATRRSKPNRRCPPGLLRGQSRLRRGLRASLASAGSSQGRNPLRQQRSMSPRFRTSLSRIGRRSGPRTRWNGSARRSNAAQVVGVFPNPAACFAWRARS